MYYPYLRGRQNELLAIRELQAKGLLSTKITPIIEPVKVSPTLISTLSQFEAEERSLIIISNPQVGSFFSDAKNKKNEKYVATLKELIGSNNYMQRGFILNKSGVQTINKWIHDGVSTEKIYCFCLKPDLIKSLEDIESEGFRTIVPYQPAFRRIKGTKIVISDSFIKKPRNADYRQDEDEFFSDAHLYYQDEYVGFSDYSIIGEEYSESGFAPYAVAIHIVYFTADDELRIHHFVSDDDEDIQNSAGKFYQALKKLMDWNKKMQLDTYAMKEFSEIYKTQSYPGLGYIKKLSIMHHLELMSAYLEKE